MREIKDTPRSFRIYQHLHGNDSVYTTGYHKYSGGYDWYELDDGNYIAGSLIGY